ncbi:hypothetical protein RJ641_017724 [Dillenia turbinata]|uniref:3'-5' exonuclease domain-containing protein n=1 Tax=Dillenia turbinata TaxID=194707 RepID=A0AAN8UHN1_9MAGN
MTMSSIGGTSSVKYDFNTSKYLVYYDGEPMETTVTDKAAIVDSSADIRELAIYRWPGRFRRLWLKDFASEAAKLRMKKPKHVCMGNWDARVLNEHQVEYASIDAYASCKLGHKLLVETGIMSS